MLAQKLFCAFVTFGFLGGCVRDLELGESDTDPPVQSPVPDVIDDVEAWSFDYAQRRCAALRACGCTMPLEFLSEPGECESQLEQMWVGRFAIAGSTPAEFVQECLDENLDLLALDCDVTSPPASRIDAADAEACRLFVGSAELGEQCGVGGTLLWPTSTCVPGLICTAGGCREYPEPGEPCLPDSSAVSNHYTNINRGRCGPETVCLEGTCEPIRQFGESCELRQCAPGLYCEAGSCRGRVAAGTACMWGYECASGRCEGQMCSPPLAALCGLSPEEYPPILE